MSDRRHLDDTVPSRRSRPDEREGASDGGGWSQIPGRVWAFAVVVAILLFVLFGFWALYVFRGRFGAQGPTPTAIIWTPTPPPTPVASATPTPTEPPPGDVPGDATPTASPDVAIGGYVRVAGTGGYGLSLREGPGSNYARMDVAAEDEVFVVVEGPQTVAGSPWWRIRDPDNEERTWWAAGNYLQPTERP